MSRKKNVDATFKTIIERKLQEIDPETELTNMEVIVDQMLTVAKGKKGGVREFNSIVQMIVDRVDGKVKEQIQHNFFDALPEPSKDVTKRYAAGNAASRAKKKESTKDEIH
jgi:hypothetical protein